MKSEVIKVRDIVTSFGETVIHDKLNLTVNRGEIYGILGESGSGKTLLLKEMIMLHRATSGSITILGNELSSISYQDAQKLRKEWGILFQFGALFTSLTVAENIELQLKEYTNIDKSMRDELVKTKISMVGLPVRAGGLYPSELSGGMIKRVALARALAMDPKLLFLDEPTSGLDPIGARNFDSLILELKELLGITVVMITHDLDTIYSIIDRFSVLADKHVVAEGSLESVIEADHPFVEKFFKNDYAKRRLKGESR
ncbi:Methionine ABC transporter ATP-binding protein [hydrothermal vent metagenome]|uniref:Methionine ABC transporter ATP-binding protein n=1 Tax=hydrothermal vent metagenome TaxID=652676 RepID=A0A1W1BHQ6_9ZZZZ